MSESTHRPKAVANQLGVSPATLRLWSTKFQAVLSPSAQSSTTEKGTAAQRRYSDQDVRFFHRAKQLLGEGKTHEETLAILSDEGVPDPQILAELAREELETDSESDESTNVLSRTSQAQMALISLREALSAKDETIAALHQTISANERHVEDLRAENERLREQLREWEDTTTRELATTDDRVWWKKLLGIS